MVDIHVYEARISQNEDVLEFSHKIEQAERTNDHTWDTKFGYGLGNTYYSKPEVRGNHGSYLAIFASEKEEPDHEDILRDTMFSYIADLQKKAMEDFQFTLNKIYHVHGGAACTEN